MSVFVSVSDPHDKVREKEREGSKIPPAIFSVTLARIMEEGDNGLKSFNSHKPLCESNTGQGRGSRVESDKCVDGCQYSVPSQSQPWWTLSTASLIPQI